MKDKRHYSLNDSLYYDRKLSNSGGSYRTCFYCFMGIVLTLIVAFLTSCKSTQYIPVETVKTEVIHNTDTVIVRDTINNEKETTIREATPADSLLLAKVGIQLDESKRIILLLQKELAKKSHTEIERTSDTVTVEKEVQVPYPVEKKLTKWEETKMETGGIAIAVCIAFVIMVIVGFMLRARKK